MTGASGARCAVNRVVLILLSLAGLIAALAVVSTPTLALSTASAVVTGLRAAPATAIESTAIVVAVVCAIVFILEIVGRGGQRIFEARVDGGAVEYPIGMIVRTLEAELSGLDGVQDARARVTGSGRKVDVRATLAVPPEEDSQAVATRAASAVHAKLEGLGLETGRLRLALKPAPDESAPRRRVPQVA